MCKVIRMWIVWKCGRVDGYENVDALFWKSKGKNKKKILLGQKSH